MYTWCYCNAWWTMQGLEKNNIEETSNVFSLVYYLESVSFFTSYTMSVKMSIHATNLRL